jgi:hypothetical protein
LWETTSVFFFNFEKKHFFRETRMYRMLKHQLFVPLTKLFELKHFIP